NQAGGGRLAALAVLAQRQRSVAHGAEVDLEMSSFVMVAQKAANESGVDMSVLLLQQQRGPAPAAQGRRLPHRVDAQSVGEIELAAVAGPPALRNGMLAQAGRDPVPVLVNHGEVADGANL